jgi:hypothetical protein
METLLTCAAMLDLLDLLCKPGATGPTWQTAFRHGGPIRLLETALLSAALCGPSVLNRTNDEFVESREKPVRKVSAPPTMGADSNCRCCIL